MFTGSCWQNENWRLSHLSSVFPGFLYPPRARTDWPHCDHLSARESAERDPGLQQREAFSTGEGTEGRGLSWTWHERRRMRHGRRHRGASRPSWLRRNEVEERVESRGIGRAGVRRLVHREFVSSSISAWYFQVAWFGEGNSDLKSMVFVFLSMLTIIVVSLCFLINNQWFDILSDLWWHTFHYLFDWLIDWGFIK